MTYCPLYRIRVPARKETSGTVGGITSAAERHHLGRMDCSFPHTMSRYLEVYSGVQVVRVM